MKLKIGERAAKFSVGEILKANEDDRTVTGIASIEVVDRDGDIISIDGLDLRNFKKNAVMPWGHDYRNLPVAKIIKIWKGLHQGKKALFFTAQFAGLIQAHPLAEAVYRMFRDDFIRSFSIGFIPLELEPNKKNGFHITKAELLEISAVVVGSNARALVTASKSFGIGLDKLTELWNEGLFKADSAEKIFEETENEYRYRIREPNLFDQDSFRTITFQKKPPIRAIIGKLKGETTTTLQALRFPKKNWTKKEAKAWIAEHRDELKDKSFDDAVEKQAQELEADYRIDVRDETEFEDDSFITREFQRDPAIFAIYGTLKNAEEEDAPKLKTLIFPKTDWEREEVEKWFSKNESELKDKEFAARKGKEPIAFLTKLLAEKHEELKKMRKFFTKFSEAVQIERTADELDTIEKVGLSVLALLKQFKLLPDESQTPADSDPTPPAKKKSEDLIDSLMEGDAVLDFIRSKSPEGANRRPPAEARTAEAEDVDPLEEFIS